MHQSPVKFNDITLAQFMITVLQRKLVTIDFGGGG